MTQSQSILKLLQSGEQASKLKILRQCRCINAGERIRELREDGWHIDTIMARMGKKRVGLYTLARKRRSNKPYNHRVIWQ